MNEYIELLKSLISTPSLSREEDNAANIIRIFLKEHGITYSTKLNNTWIKCEGWKEGLPVILLNSHIDTVKPAKGYTRDPFSANIEENKLFGLGSNDAGGALVTLLAVFIHLNKFDNLPYNLIYAATAEEEISGINGIECILNELGSIDLAIIGEPTKMQMAIAEKGLLVLDCTSKGKAGHAAREEGENAIYKAIHDIEILRNYVFPKTSELLGPVKITVSIINAGYQHNVVPDICTFVTDVRTNEFYSNQKAFEIIKDLIESEVVARSFRLNSSGITTDHPIVKRGIEIGLSYYGSPTTSDQAVLPFPSIKIGPGDSARSHSSDEYILLEELEQGFIIFANLLKNLRIK